MPVPSTVSPAFPPATEPPPAPGKPAGASFATFLWRAEVKRQSKPDLTISPGHPFSCVVAYSLGMDHSTHDASLAIPAEMPVMVLSDCHLFPGCLLPLYIFEERYRAMLAHALQSHRMFCIGNRNLESTDEQIHPHTTAGLVRACVQQDDGTSHLLLLGIRRIRMKKWLQEVPFRIAAVETVETLIPDEAEVKELKDQALKLFKVGKDEDASQLCETLKANPDPELVCDVLSYHFTRCPKLQQKLLNEASLSGRFHLLIEALKRKQCL